MSMRHPEQSADPPKAPPRPSKVGLADALRTGTQALHTEAERSGVIRMILRGQVSLFGYALYLRNLLPAYLHLEDGLERHSRTPALAAFARPAVYRAEALESDLVALFGPDWDRSLPLLTAGRRYGASIAAAAEGDGRPLIAHAYARYLGDLNGGQILKRVMARSLGIGPESLSFYDFPQIADLNSFKSDYRDAIDAVDVPAHAIDRIIREACSAFRHNIAISLAVETLATAPEDLKG